MNRFRHKRTARPSAAAFTLIEMAVVLSIAGVVAALAYTSFHGLRARAASRNGIRELESVLEQAHSEALGRGESVVFFLHPANGGVEFGALVDPTDAFDPTHLDASILPTDVMLAREPLAPGVRFRDATSDVFAKPLPAPFVGVPADSPCTFCDNPGELVVVFHSDGSAALGTTPAARPLGGSFALVASDPLDSGPDASARLLDEATVAILSPTGTVATFDR